jgi:hypothetical protein
VALGELAAAADVTGDATGDATKELAAGVDATTAVCDAGADEPWVTAAWCDVEQAPIIKAATLMTAETRTQRGSNEGTPHLRASGGPLTDSAPVRQRLESFGW